MADWHSKVYKMKDDTGNMLRQEWREIRAAVLNRDYCTCQRCEKKSKSGKGLSVHHIVPRDEGGTDELLNLITLCDPCHDIVEINEYRTIGEIVTLDEKVDRKSIKVEADEDDWHLWVYGGYRNPKL